MNSRVHPAGPSAPPAHAFFLGCVSRMELTALPQLADSHRSFRLLALSRFPPHRSRRQNKRVCVFIGIRTHEFPSTCIEVKRFELRYHRNAAYYSSSTALLLYCSSCRRATSDSSNRCARSTRSFASTRRGTHAQACLRGGGCISGCLTTSNRRTNILRRILPIMEVYIFWA